MICIDSMCGQICLLCNFILVLIFFNIFLWYLCSFRSWRRQVWYGWTCLDVTCRCKRKHFRTFQKSGSHTCRRLWMSKTRDGLSHSWPKKHGNMNKVLHLLKFFWLLLSFRGFVLPCFKYDFVLNGKSLG